MAAIHVYICNPAQRQGHSMKHFAIITLLLSMLAMPRLCAEEKEKRPVDTEMRQQLEALIAKLNSDEFDEREKASQAIVKIGKPALPALIEAAKKKSESGMWARRLIQQLGWNWETAYAKLRPAE